jgi:hypothetical protein
MRPTANLRQVLLAILGNRVIAAIGVRLQVTVIAFQELFRPLPTMIACVVVKRVVVVVLRPETGWKFWAVINYGWESVKFYKKWAGAPASDRSEWQGPKLDPLSEQTP